MDGLIIPEIEMRLRAWEPFTDDFKKIEITIWIQKGKTVTPHRYMQVIPKNYLKSNFDVYWEFMGKELKNWLTSEFDPQEGNSK